MRNSIVAELESHKWAMESTRLKAFLERVAGLSTTNALQPISLAANTPQLQVIGDVAVIPISGVLLKTVPGWVRFLGIAATGYDEIQSMIESAVAGKTASRIHLQIDSPGGQIDGLVEAADAISAARDSKPVTATIEDLGASAAYWLASQAESIDAGRNTEVGSIGVYSVYVDYSEMAASLGAKVIVIRSGEHKGMGVMGAEITDAQIATVQEIIDAMADNFIESVAAGRGKSSDEIRKLATGQLWIATSARELGLIDAVTESGPGQSEPTGNNANQVSNIQGAELMDDKEKHDKEIAEAQKSAQKDEQTRASELGAQFSDDPAFAMKAVTEGWSLTEARAEYSDVLKARLAESEKKNAAGQAAAEGAEGADALETGGSDDADSGGDFIAEAREMAEAKSITVTAAMKRLRRQKPGSHAAFLERSRTDGKAMYAEAV